MDRVAAAVADRPAFHNAVDSIGAPEPAMACSISNAPWCVWARKNTQAAMTHSIVSSQLATDQARLASSRSIRRGPTRARNPTDGLPRG